MNNVNSVLIEGFVYNSRQRYFTLANTRYTHKPFTNRTSLLKVRQTGYYPAIGEHLRVVGRLESTLKGGGVYIVPERIEKYNGESWEFV